MLSYFPKPYPDEDFRSIIFRYHIRTGKLYFEETNKELFDVKSKRNIYFHHNLIKLISLFNQSGYTIDYFLNNHTVFPLINPFLSTQRKQDFQQSLSLKDSLKGKRLFKDYIAKEIKYCPHCLEDDYEKYGEVYSHRFHQLHFMDYCERHQIELISICPKCGVPLSNANGKMLLRRPFCENGHNLASDSSNFNECPKLIERVLQDFHYIVSRSSKINRELILDLFYSALGKRGYAEIYSEYLQTKRLKTDFLIFVENHYQILGAQHHKAIDSRFNMLLSRKDSLAPNILAYLLLIQFISNSSEEFFLDTIGFSIDIPFKNRPQPCLNKICKYYNKLIIKAYSKTYYPIYVQGTFLCPHCSYQYGRKWIWNQDKKSGEINPPFLISRGKLWEKEVMKLYSQGQSLKVIAAKMGLGTYKDPIAKLLKEKLGEEYAKRFNLKTNFTLHSIHSRLEPTSSNYEQVINEIEIGMKEVATTIYDQQLLLIRRQNIVNIMNENPTLKRKGIEELARADYRWLMKNDREWFNEFLPKPYTVKNKC
ncbi:TnsD family Tn7-like transposition protein [Psychrobacillus lasiicapitis]|uniref:Uncharacterized protein n=1 Tax=Psychrobacillus lasiicapitis TaxID=1636719 RepID=A0A544SS28_9BACI|nr:TnsD family Tn7-like transposition protein [Psychrobacillus lasiicapitis]TQR08010.1 hypothetical protein FG382_22035 [Psychrobacillus lasiicapitis]GGA49975.1 hypothetical protein GCM10011384_44540 [Psychrobacillus lasiicapitis]